MSKLIVPPRGRAQGAPALPSISILAAATLLTAVIASPSIAFAQSGAAPPVAAAAGTDPGGATGTAAPAEPAPPPEPAAPAPAATATDATAPAAAPVLDAAAVTAIVDAEIAKQPPTAGWKDGFFIQTADGTTRLEIGGYTQFDGRFFAGDDAEKNVDQFGFRRLRPDLQGTLLGHYDFRLLSDFAGGKVVIQDAYVDIRYFDEIKVRFGKFKAPVGLERLQSAPSILFIERGFPTLLVPNRDLGIQLFGDIAKGLFSYQVGVFDGVVDGGSADGDTSDDKEAAARVFVQPFVTGSQPWLEGLGVGAAVSFGDKKGSLAQSDLPTFKSAGQNTFFAYRVGEDLASTAIADGTHWRATAQGYWYAGPLGLLGEYVHSVQDVSLGDTGVEVANDAWQVAAQVVVTGDDATYKGVSPKKPIDPSKGQWGALDVAARYTELRVDGDAFAAVADPAKSARQARAFAGGINWYANKNVRIALDYERTQFEGGGADGADRPTENALLGRVQTVF